MKRRDFLKKGALAAAGAGLLGSGTTLAKGLELTDDHKSVNFNVNGKARMHLTFEPYELKLKHVFTVSSFSRSTTPDVQVRIDYDGYTGYGEASMPPYLGQTVESVCSFLKKVDLEQFPDPFCIDDILTYIDSLSDGDSAAKAAVDIALHDLVGKIIGAPWHRMLGLNPEKTPNTTYTIGIDTDEMVKLKTREVAGQFKILKVKLGTPRDREMIRAIREVSDLPIAVDVNQGWKNKKKALDEIFWLKEQGIVMVEQPMPKEMLDANAWLTERSPLPTFADEAIQRLKDIPAIKGAYTGINIKLMKCTGMREAWKMMNYARAEGMKVMIGCMTETSCAIAAAAQLSPAVDFADLDGNLLIANDIFRGTTVIDGKITLNQLPGIGIEKI
ncbi:tat (Twin-arginine translocation) pathway signal sequence [Bacteroides sp. CAG:545]|nr:tat (Twin-arginine translocation) pathway signal sequence [Bacteroides sp. CAG:545]